MDNTFSISLPEDLEREIFELAAGTSNSCRIKLALVSRKVNCWVLPKLYRTLIFSYDVIFHNTDAFSRYGHHTRDILFAMPHGEMSLTQCLPYFPCVETLLFSKAYLGEPFLRVARDYPCLKELWVYLSVDLTAQTYGFKSFSKLTHLSLFKSVHTWNEIDAIQYFPVLSHLLLVDPAEEVVVQALANCLSLELVLAARPTMPAEILKRKRSRREWTMEFLEETYGQVRDIRVVLFRLVGWSDMLNEWGTRRLWSGGEKVVEERAKGR